MSEQVITSIDELGIPKSVNLSEWNKVYIKKIVAGHTKAKGTPYIKLVFQSLEIPDAAEIVEMFYKNDQGVLYAPQMLNQIGQAIGSGDSAKNVLNAMGKKEKNFYVLFEFDSDSGRFQLKSVKKTLTEQDRMNAEYKAAAEAEELAAMMEEDDDDIPTL